MSEFFTIPEEQVPTREQVLEAMRKVYKERHDKHPSMYPTDAKKMDEWIRFHYPSYMAYARARRGEALDTVPYTRELSDFGDLMTVEEWVGCCEEGGFNDYDGYGHPVRVDHIEWKDGMDPTKFPTIQMKMSDMSVNPSLRHLVPKDATHIMWFNR